MTYGRLENKGRVMQHEGKRNSVKRIFEYASEAGKRKAQNLAEGSSGMGTSHRLALPVTIGGIGGGASQGKGQDTTLLPMAPMDWLLN